MKNYKNWKKERDAWLENADNETKGQIEVFMGLAPEDFGLGEFNSENARYEICVNVVFEFQKKLSKEEMKTCIETIKKETEKRKAEKAYLKKLHEEEIEREKIRKIVEEVLIEKWKEPLVVWAETPKTPEIPKKNGDSSSSKIRSLILIIFVLAIYAILPFLVEVIKIILGGK